MNKIEFEENIKIEDMIYHIRGQDVMLDTDLARLYAVETKRINEAVKNNPLKFPERYVFRLTEKECINLKSNTTTSSLVNMHGGSRKGHNVFTEQGVAMLATVLKSKTAIDVSVRIMDAFVAMRHFLIDNKDIYKSLTNINNKIIEYDSKLNYIFSKFSLNGKLITDKNDISYIKSIFSDAENELIVIDPYLDDTIYSLIKDITVNIILIASNKKKLTINKNNIRIIYNNTFHDRYIILDRSNVFLVGASFNYIGNKTSTIIKIEDTFIINNLFDILNNLLII